MRSAPPGEAMTATTAPKPFCFVLMPFSDTFNDVYKLGIKAAAEAAGAYSERVDEQQHNERITDRIFNQIAKADLLIADMTGKNANVFYEVGYAHALNRPVVLVTQKAEDIPFDLKDYPHIVYGSSISTLKDELTKKISWHLEHPRAGAEESRFPIELWMNNEPMSQGDAMCIVNPGSAGRVSKVHIAVENTSNQALDQDSFRIAAITPATLRIMDLGFSVAPLPDGNLQHIVHGFSRMFPGEFREFEMAPDWSEVLGQDVEIKIRVYTQVGARDFPLKVAVAHGRV